MSFLDPLIYDGDSSYMEVPSPTTLRWQFIKDDLYRRQADFMRSVDYNIWVGTWNVNGQDITESLLPWLIIPDQTIPDIVFISLQEMDRRPEAYLMAVSSKEAAWNTFLLDNIQQAHHGTKYALVVSKSLVGIYAVMFVREELRQVVSKVSTVVSPCGLIGMVGNKGAVGIRAKVHSEYICFIGSHLAPHVGNVWKRNRDYADLSRRLLFPVWKEGSNSKPASSYEELIIKWNDNESLGTIWDCGLLIWTGDLNYRVALGPMETFQRALQGDYDTLLLHDQLRTEIAAGRAYQPFSEGPIDFPPTFKYNIGSDSFSNRADPRPPAWTDRILYRSTDSLKVRRYTSTMDLQASDHKPVSCLFAAKVKTIDEALFGTVYGETLRRLDQFENEAIPMTVVSGNILEFGEIVYMRPVVRSFELLNTGQVIARFCFIQRPDRDTVVPPWVKIRPTHGIVYPGYSVEVRVLISVDKESAIAFNKDERTPEDILILHVEGGKDHFVHQSQAGLSLPTHVFTRSA